MGSNILSRSFQIETEQEHQSDQEGDGEAKTSSNSAMDVDETEESDKMEAESDDEEGDVSAITMVPVADLLNACYGCNNVRATYLQLCIVLMSTYRLGCSTKTRTCLP